jgi:nitrite reductase/ring-hydroxylating ferredoxin subunit
MKHEISSGAKCMCTGRKVARGPSPTPASTSEVLWIAEEGKFVCPWHGATYDMATGAREAGPASKSSRLMFLSTREEEDALLYVWGE